MFYEGKTLKEAKKDVDSFWSYLHQKGEKFDWRKTKSGEIVTADNIDDFIPEIAPDEAEGMLQQITAIDKAKGSWNDYFKELQNNNQGCIVDLIKNTDDLSKLTGDDLVKANQNARQAAIAHNAALKQQTLGAKATRFAMSALATVGNMVGGMLIGFAVSKTIEFFSNLANEVENTREAAEGFSNSISNFNQNLKENRDTLSTLNDRYKELSQGVGKFGQNLRLSSADYEEYKDIISQVSDIMPDLAVRYNEQGEKIGFVKGQIEDLTDAYKEWQQTQAKKFIFEGDENGNTFQDVLDNYSYSMNDPSESSWDYGKKSGHTGWWQKEWASIKESFTLGYANTVEETWTAEAKRNNLRDIQKMSRSDAEEFIKSQQKGLKIDDDEAREFYGASASDIEEMTDERFEQWRNNLNGYISKYQSEIDSANNKLREGMKMLVMSQDGYWAEGVSDEERGAISNFISSMTEDMLKTFMDEDGNISQAALSNFVSKITNAFATDGELFNAYDSLMAEEFENMPYAESTQAVNGWISKIASSTGFTAEQLKEMFGVNEDVMEPLRKTLTDGGLEKSVAQIEKSFGRLRGSHIEEITSMMTSSGKSTEEQAKALDILGQSMDSFDKATGGELTRILENLDSSDPESVKKYNEEIQNFFDTIKNSDEFGEEFSSVIGVLEDALGDASVAFENFEAKYNNFLALAEKGDTSTGETAISKAIEVLKTGLEEGNVSSNLFNEALNLVFGDKRPSNLADALSEIELLFGTGENSATKLYSKLGQYTENGVVNFKKMREELNLSDATFVAFKEKLRDMGVFLANTQDMNLIGDGLGISNDKVLQFESSAQSLVKQLKDGTINAEKYNTKVKELSTSYGLASDAAIDFERNMSFAATDKYRVADDEFGGNLTSFLGIGGDVALEIESFIAQTHDQFKNAEITPESILDTDSMKEDIRQKLRETGEYTEDEIESLVSEIEKRVKTVRLETAVETELSGVEVYNNANTETQEAIKNAITDSFDSSTGMIDLGKLEANISGLEIVKDGSTAKDTLMESLGFVKDGDSWSLDKSTGIGKLAVGLSTETATQNLQGVIEQAGDLKTILEEIDKCTTVINVKHDDLANAEGQALSTKYTLQDMQRKGYHIPVTFTYKDKPSGFQTETTTVGGDSESNGNAFVNGNAFNNGHIGAKKTEDALFGELGQEIIVDAKKGTWRTVGDNGAEFDHINKGDIVFNAEQTKALLKNGKTNSRGKSYAGGTAYVGRTIPPSNSTTTTTTTTTTKSTTSSSKGEVPFDDSYYSFVDAWITENEKEIERLEREYESLNRKFESALDSGNKEQAEILRAKLTKNAQTQKDILHQQNEAHRITQSQLLESLYQYAPELTGKSWDEISEVDLVNIENILNRAVEAASEDTKDQASYNLNQFKGIVDDLKTIDKTIKDNSDAWWDEDENIEDYYRSLIDFQEDYSRDWIDNQKAFDKMTEEEELAAYDRMIVNNENFIEQILADTRLSEEAKAVLIKEANDRIIEIEKDSYDQRKEMAEEAFGEATDLASSYIDSQKTLLQSYYDVTNSIAEAQHEINKELEASKTMYEYLDEDTRKLLFNQEDYNKLSKELYDIQDKADKLQREYQRALDGATLETIEEITSQYEMQYETLMKSYEIAKADLEVAKKKQKLDNVLNERNVKMLINGKWEWVANTQDVIDAQSELADAKYARKTAEATLEQTNSINDLTAQQDKLGTIIKKFENGVIDMDTAVYKVTQMLDSLPSAIQSAISKMTKSSSSNKTSSNTSSYSSSGGGSGISSEYVSWAKSQMAANSAAWHTADDTGKAALEKANQSLGSTIGSTYDDASGTWKHKYASGTKHTQSGDALLGEVEPEMYITNNGHLIPINQPTIGNLDSGGIVFNQDQMANLRSLWDLSNISNSNSYSMLNNKATMHTNDASSTNLYGDIIINQPHDYNEFTRKLTEAFKRKTV